MPAITVSVSGSNASTTQRHCRWRGVEVGLSEVFLKEVCFPSNLAQMLVSLSLSVTGTVFVAEDLLIFTPGQKASQKWHSCWLAISVT